MSETEEEKLPIRILRSGEIKCFLSDVGGYDEAKTEIMECVNYVNHQEIYKKLGARMPKGILLVGPPGNGKTLLARATAGDGNIPFIACSSSSLLIGDKGVNSLRKVFAAAADTAPCVLYFDELDCIGLARKDCNRETQESRALTEELLVQLDGFQQQNADKLVLVMASTNHKGDLDEALLRPGRFDRVIDIPEPDLPARFAIMRVHLKPLQTKLDKDQVAKRYAIMTSGFSGAQLSMLCNEAAMIAGRDANEHILMEHFDAAMDRVRSGVKKCKPLSKQEKLAAARHDAAHAVAGWFLNGVTPPTKLGILPSSSGEIRCSQSTVDLGTLNKVQLKNAIAVALAGAAAEQLENGDGLHGANCCNDLLTATKAATRMVTECGMGGDQLGLVHFSNAFKVWGDCKQDKFVFGNKTFDLVHEKIKAILDECLAIAKAVLKEHSKELQNLSENLADKNLLTMDMIAGILGPHPALDMESLNIKDADFVPCGIKDWNKCDDDVIW